MRLAPIAIAALCASTGCVGLPDALALPDIVQTVETSRVLDPLVSVTRDGRRYVEFAPSVETRNVVCTPVAGARAFDCTFESRERDFLQIDVTEWAPRRERLIYRNRCWQFAPLEAGA